MKKINKKPFLIGFSALAIALGVSVNISLLSNKNKSISNLSLANVEALAHVEINSVDYMTAQEISNAMNSFHGWLWQEYWVPCMVNLSVKVTKTQGSFTVGAMYYGIDGVATLNSSSVQYTFIANQPGQQKYCPDGGGLCVSRSCQ